MFCFYGGDDDDTDGGGEVGGADDGGDKVGKEIQSLAETGVLSIFSFLLKNLK